MPAHGARAPAAAKHREPAVVTGDATEVQPVLDRRGFADFLRAPHRIRRGDPNWVPPLTLERRLHFSGRNPYFRHARARYFVAYRDGAPVGRISAQIDRLAQPDPEADPSLGHFGCLEAADTAAVDALLAAAEAWLADHGIGEVQGPFSLNINDEAGLLVDGFDRPPRMLMNHAPPWYGPAIADHGYAPAKDLLAYRFDAATPLPQTAVRMAEHAASAPGIRERPMNPARFRQDLHTVVDIFNDAWAQNWGFVPMTEAEAGAMADNMKPLVRPELIRFVERDGEPVAMIVALPDLYEAIADLGGRLLPFNWARLAYRLKANRLSGARVLLMGVRPAHRSGFLGSAIAALLVQRTHAAARAAGFREVELSWVLDDNHPTRRLVESIGGAAYKRYRVYRKVLA